MDLGAEVLLVDSLIPEYGGNVFNIEGIRGRVTVNIADVRDECSMTWRGGEGMRRRRAQHQIHRRHGGRGGAEVW